MCKYYIYNMYPCRGGFYLHLFLSSSCWDLQLSYFKNRFWHKNLFNRSI